MNTKVELKVTEYKDDSDIYISVTVHDSTLIPLIEATVRSAFVAIRCAVDIGLDITKLPKKEDDSIPS